MRRITLYFLYAEVLDIITTALAIRAGMMELNPLINLGLQWFILIKIFVAFMIALILEKKKPYPIDIILPYIAVFFPLANAIQLLFV